MYSKTGFKKMGIIEDSIIDNYNRSINSENTSQAQKSVELHKILRSLIENRSFIDYDNIYQNPSSVTFGKVVISNTYKYDYENGIVIIRNSSISLTKTENKFFSLLDKNQTFGNNFNVIKRDTIKYFMWPAKKVSYNAIRILIKRLRQKIEENPLVPRIILNFNNKGYIFVARSIL